MRRAAAAAVAVALLAATYWLSRRDYLLFHCLAELFSVVIAAGVFVVAWSARTKTENRAFVFLGVVYLAVAVIDLFHTLSYVGMNVFPPGIFYANQLWIGARGLESLSLLAFALMLGRRPRLPSWALVSGYGLATGALLASVFVLKIFPVCFIAGRGQTPFKIAAEYLICAVLAAAIAVSVRKRAKVEPTLFRYLIGSLSMTIASEFCFTLYTDNYGVTNVLGHLFKIVSFYLIYRSVIAVSIENPYAVIFSELNRKVGEISELNRRLELANATKDRFFSIIAHDLRNPIGGLTSALDLIAEDWDSTPDKERREQLLLCASTGRQASNLLENLLLWARSQTGALEVRPERLALRDLAEEAIELAAENAAGKGVAMTNRIGADASVEADRGMAATVLRNLVGNAVKFTPSGGSVAVDARTENGGLRVEVSDSGVGIPADRLERLFRIDAAVHTRGTAGEAGSGLGLILCREFAERIGARLEVSSRPGQGSVFSLVFPGLPGAAAARV
jgi:nitrogen-specific signal transduction histidine kinase